MEYYAEILKGTWNRWEKVDGDLYIEKRIRRLILWRIQSLVGMRVLYGWINHQ
ncbi:unnamed protein product [Linum tenue]|uniref:Uncharacterized protein n=1 Tax=Linum tenue TaxID=586396 RepID=A0AAV0J5N6_9ROSI|nr:unnamed protein product [Linum tenue]